MNKNLIIIVLMGVSGSGKTTIGKILSKEKNIPFFDADDYHPKENIKMMKEGKPLNDKNRLPWLVKINNLIKKSSQVSSCVIACSSLKKKYRSINYFFKKFLTKFTQKLTPMGSKLSLKSYLVVFFQNLITD